MFQLIKQLSNQKFQICPCLPRFFGAPTGNSKYRFPGIPGKPESATRSFFFFLLTFSFLFLANCEKQTTPPVLPNPQVTLTAEAGVIEAWLTVTTEETEGAEVLLTRDGAEHLRFSAVAETTVIDTGLQPAHTYTYAAELWQNGKRILQSETATAATLDTTSHNFTWEIFEFGGARGSSVLYDVAIVKENDIWAVGEIHTAETDTFDSLGNWVPPFNAVHWNGLEWELVRFMVPGPGFGEIYSVFAFGPNDVWMGQGSARHWDGQQWTIYNSNNGFPGAFRIRKIWGTSSENLYFVGDNGNIVHYNGQSWQRIESGTETTIQDIWGVQDSECGEWEILCAVSEVAEPGERKILRISPNNGIDTLAWIANRRALSIWFHSFKRIFACGDGVSIRNPNGFWQFIDALPPYTKECIRGNHINDLFVVGHFGLVGHYNGVSWQNYPEVSITGIYFSCDFKEDLMVAVGFRNPDGIILQMWR